MKAILLKVIKATVTLILFLVVQNGFSAEVINIDVSSILNSRAVTTYSNSTFYPWTNGTDNSSNGYITYTAAMAANLKSPKTLPDDGFISMTTKHPDVQLNYNNAENIKNQTCFYNTSGSFEFQVPQKYYSNMMLFFTSGASAGLTITLTYSTGSPITKTVTVPKYDDNTFETNPTYLNWFYLVKDVGKFSQTNVQKMAGNHNINGVELLPDVNRLLVSIKVTKPNNWLNFWGATGITADNTAINEINASTISIYPNPAADVLNLKTSLQPAECNISIVDISGKSMKFSILNYQSGLIQINTRQLKGGIYFLKLKSSNYNSTIKFVKQ